MKYRQDKSNFKYFFYLLPILILFFWFGSFFDPRPILSHFFSEITVPVWEIEEKFSESVSKILVAIEDKDELLENNRILKERLLVSNSIIYENRLLHEENLAFRNFFSVSDGFYLKEILDGNKKGVYFAKVAFDSAKKPYDILILDRGNSDSIGSIVFNSSGYVLGDVFESSLNYSRVKLFSSYGRKVGGFIGKDKTLLEAEGLGNGNFEVSVPRDFSVTLGDRVIYPGDKNLFLGIVKEVVSEDNLPTKKVFFSFPYNLNETKIVFVSKD